MRDSKVAFEQANVETRQLLTLPAETRRAPSLPGFFDVASGDKNLFHGAAHFADVREGDFTEALSREPEATRTLLKVHARACSREGPNHF